MRAEVANIQLDVNYKCPNCYFHFRLSNSAVPQKEPVSMECPACYQNLTVPALSNKINTKNKPIKNPVIEKAISSLKVMGFNLSEATSLVNKAYRSGISVADLIKEAIKNVELSTT
jgi:predicted RNA-binding Zn-ribbon protein involved in translation (DUF1610 family)